MESVDESEIRVWPLAAVNRLRSCLQYYFITLEGQLAGFYRLAGGRGVKF